MIVDRRETEELKKQASILQEREKRMLAEERRGHKGKVHTADAWQSIAKAKAYRERVDRDRQEKNEKRSLSTSEESPIATVNQYYAQQKQADQQSPADKSSQQEEHSQTQHTSFWERLMGK